ncbi:MAG: deacetylase [Pirellulaceae bacterium]|nr:MAG: deacetylase [Pirellulaceae bacterium]
MRTALERHQSRRSDASSSNPTSIPYVITVDTEEEWDWGGPFPVRGGYGVSNIEQLPRFQALCDRYGASVTYFVDYAVLAARSSRRVILDLARHPNVEIGMHIHPWNTPPIQSDTVPVRDSFLHNLPYEVAREKLERTYQRFREYGLIPTSFRGGRYSCGAVGQRFLVERGFLVDASVCPFSWWPDEGAPDYRKRDIRPRRCQNPFVPEWPLWEMPLTLAFTRGPWPIWRAFYQSVERSFLRHVRLIGIIERLGLVRRVWLNFECESAANMKRLIRLLIRMPVDYICFTVHSSSLAVGPNPYARTPEAVEGIYQTIETMLRFVQETPGLRPATISQVAQQLEGATHACLGYQSAG